MQPVLQASLPQALGGVTLRGVDVQPSERRLSAVIVILVVGIVAMPRLSTALAIALLEMD